MDVLRPDVLEKLRQNRGEIVAELQRQAKIGSPYLPDIVDGNCCERDEVDPGGASVGAWHATAETVRCRIVAALDRLPAALDHAGRLLFAETRKFLVSPWWTEAIEYGWTLEELFGVDETAPMDCVEHWGMIVGLALAPRRGDAIEYLDAEHAVIRYFTGKQMNSARRIERRFVPAVSSVAWWESFILVTPNDSVS